MEKFRQEMPEEYRHLVVGPIPVVINDGDSYFLFPPRWQQGGLGNLERSRGVAGEVRRPEVRRGPRTRVRRNDHLHATGTAGRVALGAQRQHKERRNPHGTRKPLARPRPRTQAPEASHSTSSSATTSRAVRTEEEVTAVSAGREGGEVNDESPSQLLERAASRLEELASEATEGRWYATKHEYGAEVYSTVNGMSEAVAADRNAGGVGWDDAEWIVRMSPAVAAPLAAMLRFDAMRLRWAPRCEDVDSSYRGFELARLVLGLSVEEETTHE